MERPAIVSEGSELTRLPALAEYDFCIGYAWYIVELQLLAAGYSTRIVIEFSGEEDRGLAIFNAAARAAYEVLPLDHDEEPPTRTVLLAAPDGETLLYRDEEARGPIWLKELVVNASIAACHPAPGFDGVNYSHLSVLIKKPRGLLRRRIFAVLRNFSRRRSPKPVARPLLGS